MIIHIIFYYIILCMFYTETNFCFFTDFKAENIGKTPKNRIISPKNIMEIIKSQYYFSKIDFRECTMWIIF